MAAPLRRTLRMTAAAAATALAALGGFLTIVVGRGQLLEDACITEPPAWAAEFTLVRGPLQQGLTTFRCERASTPVDPFIFTDARPLLLTVVVVVAAVVLVGVAWVWAARQAATSMYPAGPRATGSPG